MTDKQIDRARYLGLPTPLKAAERAYSPAYLGLPTCRGFTSGAPADYVPPPLTDAEMLMITAMFTDEIHNS